MSTAGVLFAVAWAACGGACAGGGAASAPVGDRALTAEPGMIQVSPGGTGSARFVLRAGNVPMAGEDVSFSIVDDPTTPFVDARGAVLVESRAKTDAQGVASVNVRVDMPTVFRVHATAAGKEAELVLIVAVGAGNVVVAPFFVPGSNAAGRALSIDVRLLDDQRCADVNLFDPPYPIRGDIGSLPPSGGAKRYDFVSTAESSAIVGRATDGRVPIAVGCIDLLGSSLLVDGVVEVSLPLDDAVPSPIGRFALSWSLDFVPPLPAAAEVASLWRDLGDCPLDPAQLLVDCIIDALSPTTAADPLDCKPNPTAGGEGTLGDAFTARRGTPIVESGGAVTACRSSFNGAGTPSLDAIAMGLFGSPTPPLLIALPGLAADAARVLAGVTLLSTLDVQSAGRPDEYLVTHTLEGAQFVMMDAEVKLAPLALPVLTATTSAHTRDGLLVVDGHGFSLRLGRVARAGFGMAALGPRGVVPPDVGGLTTALAALARSPDGELSGCAALDRALCTAVGRASGCIAVACPAGLAALTAHLEGVFDAADGTGLDLYLSGSAPLVDARGVGYVRQFGSLIADPNAIATWSVDLRTASGSNHQITSFNGVRASSP